MRIQRRTWVAAIFAGLTIIIGSYVLFTPNRADLERVVIEAMGRHDFAAAEKALLKIRPRDSDVLQILADIAYRRGRKQDCITWLEQLAEASKQPVPGLLQVGARAFEFGLPLDAERLYRRALQRTPDALEPYSRLARLYLACRRGSDLRRLLVDADVANVPLKRDPMMVWLWVVGDRVDWYGRDSQQWLELVQKEQPEDGYAAAALIHLLLNSKQNIRARQVIERIPGAGKSTWVVTLARATLELEENRPAEALDAIQQLPEVAEQQAETWFLRGRIWLACGDVEGALLAFEHAMALDPWFIDAIYNHGRLLAGIGRKQESEAELKHALRIDEILRRCRQLMNSSQPAADDVKAVMMAAELGDTAWLRLVRQLSSHLGNQTAGVDSGLRLSLPAPRPVPAGLVARRVVYAVPHSSRNLEREADDSSDIRFVDATNQVGVQFTYDHGHAPQRWLMETLGGGVAVLDYDRDGWQDLFFAQGGKLPASSQSRQSDGQLWRNMQISTFANVTTVSQMTVAGYSHGCAVGDFNDDGFPDLLVCRYGGLTLMANQGDGTWLNATHRAGSSIEGNRLWNTSAAFADMDDDGDLDLYIAGYCNAPFSDQLRVCRDGKSFESCRPNAYPPEADTLLENLGNGQFQDRSQAPGISGDGGYGLGVIVADFDEDGAPEIFVGNDTTHNFLWHRTLSATDQSMPAFEDRGLVAGVAVDGSGRAEACMGIACGDVDGDERLDLFVTNFFDETSTFYHNLGNLTFEDQTAQFGLSNAGRQLMGWGSQFIDADNDGWLDLIIVNGQLHDQPQLSQFYRNRRGRFAEVSSSAGVCFSVPRLGRSVATWDYNRDGRVDVVISQQEEPATVLCNESVVGKSVTLSLVGTSRVRDATGAIVRARVGDRMLVRLVSSQGGYLSACSPDIVIGLGSGTVLDDLEIQWPGGVRERFGSLAAGHRYSLREGCAQAIRLPSDQ